MIWNDEVRCWEDTMRINGVEVQLKYITSYRSDPTNLVNLFTNLDISKVVRDAEDFAIDSMYLERKLELRGYIELSFIIISSTGIQFFYRSKLLGIRRRIVVEHDFSYFTGCYVS